MTTIPFPRRCLAAGFALVIASSPVFGTTIQLEKGVYESGILSSKIQAEQTIQDNSEWCWAASIATILKYYGCKITQEDIVEHVFGNLVDKAAGPDDIAAALHNTATIDGKPLVIRAAVARNDKELVGYLEKENPVLIAYEHPQGGHAVVCTAVAYRMSGSDPHVLRMTVRDPWPDSARKQTWLMDEAPAILPEYSEQARPAEITCPPPGTIQMMLAVWLDPNAAPPKSQNDQDSTPAQTQEESTPPQSKEDSTPPPSQPESQSSGPTKGSPTPRGGG